MTNSLTVKPRLPTKYPTWKEPPWSPPDAPEPEHLLTKEQLLERLREDGEEITERTLFRWQATGVIPRPIRRWHEGKSAALYPEWMPSLISLAKSLRGAGTSPDDIARTLHSVNWTATNLTGRLEYNAPLSVTERIASQAAAEERDEADRQVRAAITTLVEAQERVLGFRILHARLQLFGENGVRIETWLNFHQKPENQ